MAAVWTGTSYGEGGGICLLSGGTVQNCVFAENTCARATGNPEWVKREDGSTATFSHCAWPADVTLNAATGADALVVADFGFRNAARGDYRVRKPSPCIDSGLNQAWMEDATDLAGNPRIHKGLARGIVDIGCYENVNSGGTMLILQ